MSYGRIRDALEFYFGLFNVAADFHTDLACQDNGNQFWGDCKRACQCHGGACADVKRQPENANKAALVARLEACKGEALERLPPSKRPAQ